MSSLKSYFLCSLLVISAAPAMLGQAATAGANNPVLLQTLQQELDRAMTSLSKADPAPYFISYAGNEEFSSVIMASSGSLIANIKRHERTVDVSVRVGSRDLDNTHGENRFNAVTTASLPLEDKPDAIARVLWINTDRMYKKAAQGFLEVKTNTKVRADDEDSSPDFSAEKPQVYIGKEVVPPKFDQHEWEERVRRLSSIFKKYPDIESSTVVLVVQDTTRYFVSSEGSRLGDFTPLIRVLALGSTRSSDGMELARSETFDASTFDKLAPEQEIAAKIEKIAQDLQKLKKAPVVEPFNGPALLSGRAAAVFFHEVVGHRLEGQRQRGENEGEKGRKVELISNGILKQFLMSRMPVKGFMQSNGHGRGQSGLMPVGRQGNLIVRSNKTVADSQLRQELINEIRKQKKPFGLYFEDIAGGFTLTMRNMPQAFQVMPLMVWKVYPDGRPDELVRGVDIIGTPLNALNRIVLTGQKMDVFNGECGAESGSIPVAAAAPAMLFSEIEVQKVSQGHERPPLLPPPGIEKSEVATQQSSKPEVR